MREIATHAIKVQKNNKDMKLGGTLSLNCSFFVSPTFCPTFLSLKWKRSTFPSLFTSNYPLICTMQILKREIFLQEKKIHVVNSIVFMFHYRVASPYYIYC